MSTIIDQKVVEMQFDNGQFEKNVHTSMSTLDKLKEKLNLSSAIKDFNGLEKAVDRIDMNGLATATDTVRMKFSVLETVALGAILNITNRVTDAGISIAKNLSVDQISAGWDKYAMKTESVQTIMAATANQFDDTGKQMEYVSDQLDKLNWFTDETSFNFVDMTSNIGKFTSNAVALDTSVTAMQGISNWAAISGANIGEASRAMYNLSQALATGSVKLIDWKSIENANMATAEFKQTAIDTAVELGTLTKAGKDTYKTLEGNAVSVSNFNENLKDAWFSSDVLLKTLDKYGSFTDILYEVSEATDMTATELLQAVDEYKKGELDIKRLAKETEVPVKQLSKMMKELSSDTYDLGRRSFKAAQEAKTFQEAMDATKDAVSTGWMNTFEIIFGNYQEAKELWTNVANAMWDIFASGAEARNELLTAWKEDGGRDALLNSFANTFNAIIDIIDAVKEAFRDIFPPMEGKRLADLTRKVEAFTEKLQLSDEQLESLKNAFKGIFSVAKVFTTILSGVGKVIFSLIGLAGKLVDPILRVSGSFGKFITSLVDGSNSINIISLIFDKISKALNNLGKSIAYGISWIDKYIDECKKIKDGTDILEEHSKLAKIIMQLYLKIKNVLSSTFSNIAINFKSIQSIVSGFFDLLSNVSLKIKETFKSLFSDIGGFAIFTGLFLLLKKFVGIFDGFGNSLTDFIKSASKTVNSLEGIFGSVKEALESWQKDLNAKTLLTISAAIAILVGSLLILSNINTEKLANGILGISILWVELVESFKVINGFDIAGKKKVDIIAMTNAIVLFSVALGILSLALTNLSRFTNLKELVAPLTAITVLTGELIGVMYAMSKIKMDKGKLISSGVALIAFAEAVNILVTALMKFKGISVSDLEKGLAGIGASMLMLTASISIIGKIQGKLLSSSIAMIAMATAMNILSSAVRSFGELDVKTLEKSLISVGLLMGAIAAMMKVISGSGSISAAATILAVSVALSALVVPITALGNSKWSVLLKGIGSLAVILGTIAVTTKLINGLNLIGISAGLIAFAAAINLLTIPIVALSIIPFTDLIKSLGLLAIAMGGLGLLSTVILPLTPAITALSVAMTLFGVALVAVGGGLTLIGTGISILVSLGTASVNLTKSLKGLIKTLATVIPDMVTLITLSIQGLAKAIIESAPDIGKAALVLITTFLKVIKDAVPDILDTAFFLIITLLEGLNENMPKIVDVGISIVVNLLNGIANRAEDLVDAAFNLIYSFIRALVKAVPQVLTQATDIGRQIIDGVVNGIKEGAINLTNTLINKFSNAVDAAKNFLGIHSPSKVFEEIGINTITGFVVGIEKGSKDINNSLLSPITTFTNSAVNIVSTASDELATIEELQTKAINDYWTNLIDTHRDSLITLADETEQYNNTISQTTDNIYKQFNVLDKARDKLAAKSNVYKAFDGSLLDYTQKELEARAKTYKEFDFSVLDFAQARIADKSYKDFSFDAVSYAQEKLTKRQAKLDKKQENKKKKTTLKLTKKDVLAGTKADKKAAKEYEAVMTKLQKKTKNYQYVWEEIKDLGYENIDVLNAYAKMSTKELKQANSNLKAGYQTTLNLTKKDLLQAAKDQKKASQEYETIMTKLEKKTKNYQYVWEEIKDLGYENIDVLTAYSKMSDTELKQMNKNLKASKDVEDALSIKDILNASKQQKKDAKEYTDLMAKLEEKTKDYSYVWKEIKDYGYENIDILKLYTKMSEEELSTLNKNLKASAEEDAKLVKKDILDASKEQKAAAQEYQKIMEKLFKQAGQYEYIWKEIKDLGYDNIDILKIYSSMSDDELKELNENMKAIEESSKAAAKAVTDAIKETATATQEILDDVRYVWDSYLESFEADAKSTFDNIDIFSGIRGRDEPDFDDLTENLQQQLDEWNLYYDTIAELKEKVTNENLLDRINNAGISDLGKLLALNEASAEELEEYAKNLDKLYNRIYEDKKEKSQDLLKDNLEDILDIDNINIDAFLETFDGTLESLNEFLKKQLMTIGANVSEGVSNSIIQHAESVSEGTTVLVNNIADGIISASEILLNDQIGMQIVGGISSGILHSVANIGSTGMQVMNYAAESMKTTLPEFEYIGKEINSGIANGMNGSLTVIKESTNNVAQTIKNNLQSFLEIYSPSKMTTRFGRYLNEGFARGISKYSRETLNASDDLGNEMLKIFSRTITNISNFVEDNIDAQPKIRPILDLSSIETDTKKINALFGRNQALSINRMQNGKTNSVVNDSENQNGTVQSFNFTQNNYSPKALSKIDIYRQTKNQFSRMKEAIGEKV